MADVNYIGTTGIPKMNTPLGIHMRLIGLKELEAQLNEIVVQFSGPMVLPSLLEFAAFIRKDMDETSPTIPVGETGTLRSSWDVKTMANNQNYAAIMAGFDSEMCNYAIFVHEMTIPPYSHITWNRLGSGAKFFEAALARNKNKLLTILTANARKKIKRLTRK